MFTVPTSRKAFSDTTVAGRGVVGAPVRYQEVQWQVDADTGTCCPLHDPRHQLLAIAVNRWIPHLHAAQNLLFKRVYTGNK